jgi:enoyl-CoA hydratase/carnithine racemase
MTAFRMLLPEALDFPAIERLAAEIDRAVTDAATRVLRLEGSGSVFCRGMNLEAVSAAGPSSAKADGVGRFAHCLQALAKSTKPTLALVDGPAQGGGLGLAAACDVVLATERASFALPEVLLGLVPAVILPFLLQRMSPQGIKRWAMTGETHSAVVAREAGLVDEVVAASELESACRRWERNLSRVNMKAVGMLKQFVIDALAEPRTALEQGVQLTSQSLADETILKPIRAFLREGVAPWEQQS